MVVSQNISSATSEARFAPIKTDIGIFNSLEIICDISSMPPPSFLSNPCNENTKC